MTSWKRAVPLVVGAVVVSTSVWTPAMAFADDGPGDDGPGDDGPGGCHYENDQAPATLKTANAALSAAVAAEKKAAHTKAVTKAAYLKALKTPTLKDNKPARAAYIKADKALAAAAKRVTAAKARITYLTSLTHQCTAGIPTPTGLVATAGDSSASLTWTAVTGAASYQVYRGTTKVGSATTTAFNDSGLTNGTQYTYTVRATIGTKTSGASAPAYVTPTAPQPPHQPGTALSAPNGLAASATTPTATGAMQLTWNAVSGATGYNVLRDGQPLGKSSTVQYTVTAPPAGYHSYTVVATDGTTADTSVASAALSAGAFAGKSVAEASGRTVYGNLAVSIVASGPSKTITGCWATYPTTGASSSIDATAIPLLCSEVLAAQPTSKSSGVASVTGATATTPAFNTSLQSALVLAGR